MGGGAPENRVYPESAPDDGNGESVEYLYIYYRSSTNSPNGPGGNCGELHIITPEKATCSNTTLNAID
jgi:hypothetical protein